MIARLRRHLDGERGSASAGAFFLSLVVLALCAVLIDLYSLASARDWADHACLDASMRAVSAGKDLAAYVETGAVALDAGVARQEALAALDELATAKGLGPGDYSARVEVLERGGTVLGFPPAARASILGAGDWSSPDPSVGIYVEVRVQTAFLRGLGLEEASTVHAFAASSLTARW